MIAGGSDILKRLLVKNLDPENRQVYHGLTES